MRASARIDQPVRDGDLDLDADQAIGWRAERRRSSRRLEGIVVEDATARTRLDPGTLQRSSCIEHDCDDDVAFDPSALGASRVPQARLHLFLQFRKIPRPAVARIRGGSRRSRRAPARRRPLSTRASVPRTSLGTRSGPGTGNRQRCTRFLPGHGGLCVCGRGGRRRRHRGRRRGRRLDGPNWLRMRRGLCFVGAHYRWRLDRR